jgi:MFS family permease
MDAGSPERGERAAGRWRALAVLGAGQFLTVLDTAVMDVSISQLVKDFHTEVTAIEAVITLYILVMAACMITGGKLGDMFGRRKVFAGGLVVYAVGSALTAVAPTLAVLVGDRGPGRRSGAARAGRAGRRRLPGPRSGGRLWRHRRARRRGHHRGPAAGRMADDLSDLAGVFAGEVVVVLAMPALIRWVPADAPREGPRPRLDVVGALLSAAGLALTVLGVLQSSSWGWLKPEGGAAVRVPQDDTGGRAVPSPPPDRPARTRRSA